MAARHHYLPVFYLKRFAQMEGRVVAYARGRAGEPVVVAPEKLACEKGLYRFDLVDGAPLDPEFLEKGLSVLESGWAAALEAVHRDRRLPAPPYDEFSLVWFAAMLAARTPAARRDHELLVSAALRASVAVELRDPQQKQRSRERLLAAGHPEDLVDLALEHMSDPANYDVGVSQDTWLSDVPEMALKYGHALSELSWSLGAASIGTAFVTSDCPVAAGRVPWAPRRELAGLTDPQVEVTLPLSPDLVLIGSRARRAPLDQLNKDAVDLINTRTIFGSERWIVAHRRRPQIAAQVAGMERPRRFEVDVVLPPTGKAEAEVYVRRRSPDRPPA